MDRRRAAGALLALAACIACSTAAPTAGDHTALDLYEGPKEGCYYNFQHYGEGDRIMTNEPCLNCTCHNRMLMCYLRVCPFTKPIGHDCTVEKRADQCCPIVTCPDVPVDLLTSTSTSSPAEYGTTGLDIPDKYGCSIHGKYFPEGSKVPPTPNRPCEHCYCIRNITTCVMQECTLHVDGCTPIYHKDICCPVRYSCDHPEDEIPFLDDMSTTVRPTPGFLLTTTTLSPVTQMSQECIHNDQIIPDGASITTGKACDHCYCMKGDIVCVVQECGAPMENEGKNCTSLPPREGQCCPDTYICEGDEPGTEAPRDSVTDKLLEDLTTLSPPRRTNVEGSGYRNEPDEVTYTEMSTAESEFEGSGEEQEVTKVTHEPSAFGEHDQYLPVTTKTPISEEIETSTKNTDGKLSNDNLENESVEPPKYIPTTQLPTVVEVDEMTKVTSVEDIKSHETVTDTSVQDNLGKITTEPSEYLNTVPDIVPDQEYHEPHEHDAISTDMPSIDANGAIVPEVSDKPVDTTLHNEQDVTLRPIKQGTSEFLTLSSGGTSTEMVGSSTEKTSTSEIVLGGATSIPSVEETLAPHAIHDIKSEQHDSSTTNIPVPDVEKLTAESDQAQNTVAVAEEESTTLKAPGIEEVKKTTLTHLGTETPIKDDNLEPHENVMDEGDQTTLELNKGFNTITEELNQEFTKLPITNKITSPPEPKSTEATAIATEHLEEEELLTVPKTPKPLLENNVTKGDQYTVTTEPSFRREDEASISTEKPKEALEQTTIKAEFVDEGLIPTSTHEEAGTGSNTSSIDEDITTVAPDNDDKYKETVAPLQEITESIPVVVSTITEKITDTISEKQDEILSSTEKTVDVTSTDDLHEEPSRIPGEGDCLINAVTYRNNTEVPSTNKCHMGCKCVSSIIKCDPIICSPPPGYMNNCQSIYDTPDSCCPTYICDYPKETAPPKSDSQMSGTEPPLPPPAIECRGDQCELSEPIKKPEPCTSESCTTEVDHKPSECETLDCGVIKEPLPSQPSIAHPECIDDNCKPSAQNCAHGECKTSSTPSEIPSTKPCEGDNCKVLGEEMPSPQPCKNEDECKSTEGTTIPCEGDSCANANCGSDGCDSSTITQPQDNPDKPCNKENGCQPQEIVPNESDCTGGELCRRKDTPNAEELPSKCEGNRCALESLTPATDTSILEHTPIKDVPSEEHPLQQIDNQIIEKDKIETTTTVQIITEEEHATSHPMLITPEAEKEIEIFTEKAPVDVEIATEQLPLTEVEVTKKPNTEEETITKPISTKDNEKLPEDEKELITFKPLKKEDEHIDETEASTKVQDVSEDGYTTESALIETLATDKSYGDVIGDTEKTAIVEESTRKSDIVTEKTDKLILTMQDTTKKFDNVEEYTDKPTLTEEDGTKLPDSVRETDTDTITKTETTMPTLSEEHKDKLNLPEDQSTKIPDFTDANSDISTSADEKDTKLPDTAEKTHDNKPISEDSQDTNISEPIEGDKLMLTEQDVTKKPDDVAIVITEEQTDNPEIMKVTEHPKIPETMKENTEKSTLMEQTTTNAPDVTKADKHNIDGEKNVDTSDINIEKQTEQSMPFDKDTTKINDTADDRYTDRTPLVDDKNKILESVGEIYNKIPAPFDEQTTEIPSASDKEQSQEPHLVQEEKTEIPNVVKQNTDKTILFEEESTKMPDDTTNEDTHKTDKDTKIPEIGIEKHTNAPPIFDKAQPELVESVTPMITISDEEVKEKPTLDQEELPDKPTVVETDKEKTGFNEEEVITQSNIPDEEGTEMPEIIEEQATKKPILIDESTASSAEIEYDITTKIPSMVEKGTIDKLALGDKEITDQPSVIDKDTQKPDIMEKDHTTIVVQEPMSESQVPETQTNTPQPTITKHDDSTESEMQVTDIGGSEIFTIKPGTESKEPVTSFEEQTGFESKKDTKIPVTQTSTSASEVTQKESYVTHLDEHLFEVTSKSTDIMSSEPVVTESQEYGIKEQIGTTKLPFNEDEQETSQPSEHVTKLPESVPSIEVVTETPESDIFTKGEQIYTGMPEQQLPNTKSPDVVVIEPQKGEVVQPELNVVGPVGEESSTKVMEKDVIKVDTPESFVTPTVPKYDATSDLSKPEIVGVTETSGVIDEVTQKITLHEPTQTAVIINEQEIKSDQPDAFTHVKEEKITSTIEPAVTEPIKTFTEIEDTFVTREEFTVTRHYEESTEHIKPVVTEKPDEGSQTFISESETPLITDEKVTKQPEEFYTGYTETTITEVKLSDSYRPEKPETGTLSSVDSSTIIESSDALEYGKPLSTEITESEKKPDTAEPSTLLPPIVKETDKYPMEDSLGAEEKIPDLSDQKHFGTSTTLPEIYVTVEQASTEKSMSYITASTSLQETSPNSEEPQETGVPDILTKPGVTDTQSTVKVPLEEEKLSTEYPTTVAEIHTKTSHAPVSVEVSASVPVDQQSDISVVVDSATEKDHTEPISHVSDTVPQEKITEISEIKPEATTTKQIEDSTKFTETSSLGGLSETTPYLIELQEHTHKQVEPVSTMLTSEKETDYTQGYTDKNIEETSTQSIHKEDDINKIEQDITITSSSVDQSPIKVEDITTNLPSIKDNEISEDVTTISPSFTIDEVYQTEPEFKVPETTTIKVHENKIEITTVHSEIPTELIGEITTTARSVSDQSTLPVLEGISEKEFSVPTDSKYDKTTIAPTDTHDKPDDHKADDTTSKFTQNLVEITPTISVVTEKIPITEPDTEVTTEKETLSPEKPVQTDLHVTSDKTAVSEDELIFSTTEVAPIKEDNSQPAADKDRPTSEKPSSEEQVPSVLEKENSKPDKEFINTTEANTPLVSDNKGKPTSETGETISPVSEDKEDKKPISEIEGILKPVSEDKYGKPEEKPSSESEEVIPSISEDKYSKPDSKPTVGTVPPSPTSEIPKPPPETHSTDELPVPEEDTHFPPSGTGYGEPDYVEEDQAFGPGTCRYGGKVYVSAQQIPRDDPCDFCFCFRSDIICLQQSCPPPIHGCHEEPIQGFCCPRYECPVSMATTVNVTTTTTTTTTTLPPHFPTHSYKGAVQRRGCQIKGHTYKVGEVVRSSSGPCLHCTCGGDGQMKCDPKACTPEPMLRQMIAAAVSAKRRR